MKKKIVLGLVLILGISIGYFGTKNTVEIYPIRLGDSEDSFDNREFNDSILNVNGYEEYSILVDCSYAELEAMIYKIQKKKEREPFTSRILIQFYGDHIKSMGVQKMVEDKFIDLDIFYMQMPNEETANSVRIGITY